MKPMRHLLTIAAAAAICLIGSLKIADSDEGFSSYRSYGNWLDNHIETDFAFNGSSGDIRFDTSGYPVTSLRMREADGPGGILNATFSGGVYGLTTLADGTRFQDEGTVVMTFHTLRAGELVGNSDHMLYGFTADFEGIDALVDIRGRDGSDEFHSRGWYNGGSRMRQSGSAREVSPGEWTRRISMTGWAREAGRNADGTRENASVYMRGHAYGDALAGTVFGLRRTFGYDEDGDYYFSRETFDGAFEATEE